MLKTLSIWNFALIEYTKIDFQTGLNLLTGETGAGKSILLGALSMAIGHRTNADAIRTGCDFIRVEAVFTIESNDTALRHFLAEHNILLDDDTIIITRQISINGRNSVQVNNCHVTLTVLKQLGELLVDIHGQHSNQMLLKPAKQLAIVDSFEFPSIQLLKDAYFDSYKTWQALAQDLAEKQRNTQEMAQRVDMLSWQIKEIEDAKLVDGEDAKLEAEIKILANAEKIANLVQDSYQLFTDGGNGKLGVISSLINLRKNLEMLERYDESFQTQRQIVDDAYYQLQDVADVVRDYEESLNYSPQRLDKLQQRLDDIDKLKRKYGITINDILVYLHKVKQELDYIQNYDANIEKLSAEVKQAYSDMAEQAAILHEKRVIIAEQLSAKIKDELATLGMADTEFKITLQLTDNYSSTGADEANILFSANIGEELRPLSKIVSGGELSRIALALKTVTASKDDLDLMVFDEVDTGVGGKTAHMMAEKIAKIAAHRQVMCITHLPQIAAMADVHFHISKSTHNNKTYTQITTLDDNNKLEEIARMMSGTELTSTSLQNARELLANAASFKKNF